MAEKKPELQRGLEARHIELIALGGTIGVGLFMGAASTLKWAGPSVLLAYIIAGLFVFFIMRSMGEMLFLEPVTGSFAVYAHRYMSPFFGYLTAWSYWFMWMAVGISEITAIGVYVQFWFPEMAQWIPALIAVGLVALANLAAVRLYGEIEFWFAMIKVILPGDLFKITVIRRDLTESVVIQGDRKKCYSRYIEQKTSNQYKIDKIFKITKPALKPFQKSFKTG